MNIHNNYLVGLTIYYVHQIYLDVVIIDRPTRFQESCYETGLEF